MNLKSSVMLILSGLTLFQCGPKTIRKQPVSRENQIQAIRLVSEGDQLLQEGKDHLAMLKYLEATDYNPYFEVIYNKLAVSYSRLQMYYQARQAVNRSLGLNPKYPYAFNTKGIIELASQDIKEAVRSFKRAIDLRPGVPSFYLNYGFALVQAERPKEAMAAYAKALELDPQIFERSDFVEMNYQTPTELGPDKYFDLATVFASLGDLDFTLRYLGRAFAAGFSEYDRIASEPSFRKFADNEEFRRFLAIHGVTL